MTLAKDVPPIPTYGTAPQYPIDSVDNALRALVLLGEQRTLRLTDLSRYLGVASSTGHRLLAMLQYRGFVRQDEATRSYGPGPTLDALAFGVLRRLDVRTRARPVVERLNADLKETIHLGQLESRDVHFIDSIESPRALRVGARLGRSMPAHCTSTGKALLAQLTEEEILRMYPEEELVQLTPYSIANRTDLMNALVKVRAQGYAHSRQESEEGVTSLAVALHATQSPRLAINASVPLSRMNDKLKRMILRHLVAAAEEMNNLFM